VYWRKLVPEQRLVGTAQYEKSLARPVQARWRLALAPAMVQQLPGPAQMFVLN
jgi:hypothetical protein